MQGRMTQKAVIRSLEVIGEASRHVSETLYKAHPDVPWRQITTFRNFVIHAYWNNKLERIWDVVENDLPPLKQQLRAILSRAPYSNESDA